MNHKIDLNKSSQLTPERERILRFFSNKLEKNQNRVTLFFIQNLNGQIVDEINNLGELEEKELNFIIKSLRKEHDAVVNSKNQINNKKLKNIKKESKTYLIEADSILTKKTIEKNLFDLFISIIHPNSLGKKIETTEKLYKSDLSLNYTSLGELIVVYGKINE